ncbi:alpha/beta fold hydrolase [Roseovarius sp. EL26]|uniref:alpha/beta fold hydrolase n=1 Tax=Roseovarius sp. EL26 TaxID=2126672 RepID=UPI000EA2C62D|nr:alpha/beta hydrolase [Roseovarius sp. EL26]
MLIFKRLSSFILITVLVVLFGFRGGAALRENQSRAESLPENGRLVSTKSGEIYIIEVGPSDGLPLLFAHGTAAWGALWQPVLQEMADVEYRAIAFDMPPFGYSDRAADADYSRARQAERLLELVNALDVQPVLIAHSFGAGAAVEAAMVSPERFAGLVVVDGALGVGMESKELPLFLRNHIAREFATAVTATNPMATKPLLRSLLHVKTAATDDIVALLQRPMRLKGSTKEFARWLPFLLNPSTSARSMAAENYAVLAPLRPQYIWGAEDTITPLAQGTELVNLTPGARLHVLPDTGHIPQIEAPEAFMLALKLALVEIETELFQNGTQ